MKSVVSEFLTDNCPHLAASISYYTLFSFIPLTLAAIALLGWLTSDTNVESKVIETIGEFLPVAGESITTTIRGISRAWEATGVIAVIGLLWGGSAIFNAVRKAINAAWGIREPRPFFVERFLELCMMVGLAVLLLLSLGLTATLSVIQKYSIEIMGYTIVNQEFVWNAMFTVITVGLAFATFLLLYKFIPNTRVRWRDVAGGALLAAIGFEVSKQVFIWYATSYAHYNLVYGPVSTLISLMVWLYVSAFIMLFCAKITSVYSRSRGIEPRELPRPQETSDTAIYAGSAQVPVGGVFHKEGRLIGNALPSFSSVSWLGPVGTSRQDIKRKKRSRLNNPRERRKRYY